MNSSLPLNEQVAAYFGGEDRPEVFRQLETNELLLRGIWTQYLRVMTEGEIDIQAKELMGLCIAITKPNEYMINFQQRRIRRAEIDEVAEEEALMVAALFEGLNAFAHALQVDPDLRPGRRQAGDNAGSDEESTAHVLYVDESDDPVVCQVYDEIRSRLGTANVPRLFRAMAHQPTILQAKWESYQTIMWSGVLPERTKELIAIAVSAVNRGSYCVDAHSAAARQLGLSAKGLVEAANVIDVFGTLCSLAKGFRLAKRNF